MHIVFIACVGTKLNNPAPAEELYISPLFKKALAYARTLQADRIYILSALYGLVPLTQVIAPYNKTLLKMSRGQREQWAQLVFDQLALEGVHPYQCTATFLAGVRYREQLAPLFQSASVPMRGLGIGKQLAWLTQKASNNAGFDL